MGAGSLPATSGPTGTARYKSAKNLSSESWGTHVYAEKAVICPDTAFLFMIREWRPARWAGRLLFVSQTGLLA